MILTTQPVYRVPTHTPLHIIQGRTGFGNRDICCVLELDDDSDVIKTEDKEIN